MTDAHQDRTLRTRWFRDAGWGLFFHYLASPASSRGVPPTVTGRIREELLPMLEKPGEAMDRSAIAACNRTT